MGRAWIFFTRYRENKSKFNEIDIVPNVNLDEQGISDEAKAIVYLIVNRFLKK